MPKPNLEFEQEDDLKFATNRVIIRVPEALLDVAYSLHDPQGRVVATGLLLSSDTQIDMTLLHAVIYLLRPNTENAKSIRIQKK